MTGMDVYYLPVFVCLKMLVCFVLQNTFSSNFENKKSFLHRVGKLLAHERTPACTQQPLEYVQRWIVGKWFDWSCFIIVAKNLEHA